MEEEMAAATELIDKIQTFFDADINEYLSEHGGSAEVVDVEGNVLIIRLMGACRGCLSMSDTVDGVILKKAHAVFPFIEKVEVTEEVSPEVYEMAASLFTGGKY